MVAEAVRRYLEQHAGQLDDAAIRSVCVDVKFRQGTLDVRAVVMRVESEESA